MRKIKIINLIDNNHRGDDDNALAVSHELVKLYSGNGDISTETTELDIKDAKEFFKNINKNDNYVFIGAGEQSIETLVSAKKINSDITTIWSGHQSYAQLTDAEKYLDKIALPVTDRFEASDKSKHIKTLGVASTTTKQDFLNAYKSNKENLIESDNGYITIVMGGDANYSKTGENFLYTPEEAKTLADYATFIAKKTGKKLLITNGPRTGKFDPITGEQTQNHRGDTPTDPCSQALLDRLAENGMVRGTNFQFDDFRFLEKGVASSYASFLGAAAATNGAVLMAGESTSMLTECLKAGVDLCAFHNQAMNEDHDTFAEMLHNNGMMHYLNEDFQPIKKGSKYAINIDKTLNIETQIAKTAFEKIEKTKLKKSRKKILPKGLKLAD